MLVCPDCSLVFVDPVPALGTLLAWADEAHRGRGFTDMQDFFAVPDIGDRRDPLTQGFARVLAAIEPMSVGRRLLDVGAGSGSFAAFARTRGWQPVALDASSAATTQARERYGLETVTATFPEVDLPDRSFDAVVLLDFLEHVADPRETVSRAATLLAPGGVLFVSSPSHASLLCRSIDAVGRLPLAPVRYRLAQYYHRAHVSVLSPSVLRRLLVDAGLVLRGEGQESPVVSRFDLPRGLALAVVTIEAIGRRVAMQSRCWAAARREG